MDDIHPGLRVFIEELLGWPPFYQSRSKMPVDVADAYEYCRRFHESRNREEEEVPPQNGDLNVDMDPLGIDNAIPLGIDDESDSTIIN